MFAGLASAGTALSGVGSILSGVGGLFGKKKSASPASNIISQAKGARQAAERYGFNPLTMLQYGQPGGALGGGSSGPPLASFEMISAGLDALSPEAREERAIKREADQLNLDLAKLKLEQARSGVAYAPGSAAGAIGGGSPLGRTAVTVLPGGSAVGNVRSRGQAGGSDAADVPLGVPARFPDGTAVGADNDPVSVANKAGIPAFRLFGKTFVGSGATSSGQVFEDAGGEVISGVGGIAATFDAAATTIGRMFTEAEAKKLKAQGIPVMKIDGKYYAQEPRKASSEARPYHYSSNNPFYRRHSVQTGATVRFR